MTSCSSRTEHHTVAYLHSNVPEFIEPENWPPNSPDLNPQIIQCEECCSRWCIITKFQTLISWGKFRLTSWLSEARTQWTERLISCQKDWGWLSRQRVVVLNFVCTNPVRDRPYFKWKLNKIMRLCHIQCNFGGIDDLCKLDKEYFTALTCKLCISF